MGHDQAVVEQRETATAPVSEQFLHLSRVGGFASSHPWPNRKNRAIVRDEVSRRRDRELARRFTRLLQRILAEEHRLILHLHATRGSLTLALADAVWNATVVAVGHWCDTVSAGYPGDWKDGNPRAAGLFFHDCAKQHRRIVPLRRTPAEAYDELSRFELTPDLVVTAATSALDAVDDVKLALKRSPAARVVGLGWRTTGVGDAIRDFARQNLVELDSLEDAWCVWRDHRGHMCL
jgi:hypothetical protein